MRETKSIVLERTLRLEKAKYELSSRGDECRRDFTNLTSKLLEFPKQKLTTSIFNVNSLSLSRKLSQKYWRLKLLKLLSTNLDYEHFYNNDL